MEAENQVCVCVDDENNAEQWWAELDAGYPAITARLRTAGSGTTLLTQQEYEVVTELPGFADGPDHARTALIVC